MNSKTNKIIRVAMAVVTSSLLFFASPAYASRGPGELIVLVFLAAIISLAINLPCWGFALYLYLQIRKYAPMERQNLSVLKDFELDAVKAECKKLGVSISELEKRGPERTVSAIVSVFLGILAIPFSITVIIGIVLGWAAMGFAFFSLRKIGDYPIIYGSEGTAMTGMTIGALQPVFIFILFYVVAP